MNAPTYGIMTPPAGIQEEVVRLLRLLVQVDPSNDHAEMALGILLGKVDPRLLGAVGTLTISDGDGYVTYQTWYASHDATFALREPVTFGLRGPDGRKFGFIREDTVPDRADEAAYRARQERQDGGAE